MSYTGIGGVLGKDRRAARSLLAATAGVVLAALPPLAATAGAHGAADQAAPAAPRAPEMRLQGDEVTIPIVMAKEFPFIEGEAEGTRGKLMLDTASRPALSLNDHRVPVRGAVSSGSGFFGSGEHFAIRLVPEVDNVRAGPLAFDRVTTVQSQDATQLEGITPDFIGWFGYEAWAGYAMKLDYRRLRATFYKGGPSAYLAGERVLAVLPFATRKRPNDPIMTVRLGDVEAVAAFDTGQYGSLYTNEATRQHLLRTHRLTPSHERPGRYDLSPFELGGHRVAGVAGLAVETTPFAAAQPIGLTEANILTVGYGFLRRYKTVWDFRSRRIYLLAR